jgi:hypothetical protein
MSNIATVTIKTRLYADPDYNWYLIKIETGQFTEKHTRQYFKVPASTQRRFPARWAQCYLAEMSCLDWPGSEPPVYHIKNLWAISDQKWLR